MPTVREKTDEQLRQKFRKLYGREPSVPEFQQFKKNYLRPFSAKEEETTNEE